MVYAVLTDFRRRHPDGKIIVFTSHIGLDKTADGQRLTSDFPGLEFVSCWRGHAHLRKMFRTLVDCQPSEVVVLGADCMDGYYVPSISFALLAIADLSTRLGIPTQLTGFSFNDHPVPANVAAFRHISRRLVCNVRDPVSLRRVHRFCGVQVNARLVADVAFNLQPKLSARVDRAREWLIAEKAKGQKVLGFNVHGMLVGKSDYEAFIVRVSDAVRSFLLMRDDVSIALVPHDYRPQGDLDALSCIAAHVNSPRVHLIADVLSAQELKALMDSVDGLFTSRMHLGIAALGQGKPIGAFSYQGKFAGLFQHFQLPTTSVLEPKDIAHLPEVLSAFIADIPKLTRGVVEQLPHVRTLAEMNLCREVE